MSIRNLDTLIPGSSDLLSEPTFRRFETDIRVICNNFPASSTIKPVGYTPASYCTRLRSIMGAYAKSDWKSDIPKDTVLAIRTQRKFSYDNNLGLVFVGLRPAAEHMAKVGSTISQGVVVDANDSEVLNAVCLLKHRNFIDGVVNISNMTMDLALTMMETYPNVAIELQEGGNAVAV